MISIRCSNASSDDQPSFGVIDELSSSSNDEDNIGDQYEGDRIHLMQTPAHVPINVDSIHTPTVASPVIKQCEISATIQNRNKKARKKADQLQSEKSSAKKRRKLAICQVARYTFVDLSSWSHHWSKEIFLKVKK